MKKKQKTFVLKNIKTGKYSTENWGWSKNIFKAELYDESWVNENKKLIAAGWGEMALGRNERWVEVTLKEI